MAEKGKTAQAYAQQLGLKVFPLHSIINGKCSCGKTCSAPGKHPIIRNWQAAATTDAEIITQWWQKWPHANIGMPTGATNGLLVFDEDETGVIDSLCTIIGELPETWEQLTGGGGRHLVFKYPKGIDIRNSAGRIAPGVDIRANGGYIVVAPSNHTSGYNYSWDPMHSPGDAPLANLPLEWALFLGASGRQAHRPQKLPEQFTEGQRNTLMFKLAASLRAKGLSEASILAALREENETRCIPPLSDVEVQIISESAARYEPGDAMASTAFICDGAFKGITIQNCKPEDYSDAGNAQLLVANFKDALAYVDSMGWLYWNGLNWERSDHKAVALAIMLSDRMLEIAKNEYAGALESEAVMKLRKLDETINEADVNSLRDAITKAKAFYAHAKASRSSTRIKGMLELSKPYLVMKASDFDANPFDLNTPEGIVDLRTGNIRPNDRKAYCTQITECAPAAGGTEMWEAFLNMITNGDMSIAAFLKDVAGMAAIGGVYQESIAIFYGGGRNGKSTFTNAIGRTLGTYTGSIDVEVLTTDREKKGASMATLRGKRLVTTGELEEHKRLSAATLKKIASTDKLIIEEKYRQPETITQTHTLILFTNHLPRVGSTDGGTWRRLIVVPFLATISPGEGIPGYHDILVDTAGPAVLAWIIEGAKQFCRNGFKLNTPEAVQCATKEYRAREDWLSNFIDEKCAKGVNERVSASELYGAYAAWARSTGEYVRRMNDFNTAMEMAGYTKIRPKNKVYWIGLCIDYDAAYENGKAAIPHPG